MRVMDAKCCIALMALGEAMRHLEKEVCESHRGNPETRKILPNRLHM
jgi:hypothetical protein